MEAIYHSLIEPGHPMQNGHIESFSGKSRDEQLKQGGLEVTCPPPAVPV